MTAISVNKRQFAYLSFALIIGALLFVASPNRSKIKEVSVQEAKVLIDAGALVIDVRDHSASIASHIPGAHLYPIQVLGSKLAEIEAYKTKPIVVYCNEGNSRGPQATEMLNKAGYAQAVNLKSGIEGWRAAQLPTAKK